MTVNNILLIFSTGVLVDLHQADSKPEKSGTKGDQSKTPCGRVNAHSYQQLEAVRWAVEVINNRSWPEEFALGKESHFISTHYISTALLQ